MNRFAIEYNADSDRHVIMVYSENFRPMPAGPRLFRMRPYPEVVFSSTDPMEVAQGLDRLNKYFAWLADPKREKPKEKAPVLRNMFS